LSLSEVVRDAHLADQALVVGLRLGIPDEAIGAAIREAGAQEQRRRLLAARLVVGPAGGGVGDRAEPVGA
jgi:hypothetical protein